MQGPDYRRMVEFRIESAQEAYATGMAGRPEREWYLTALCDAIDAPMFVWLCLSTARRSSPDLHQWFWAACAQARAEVVA